MGAIFFGGKANALLIVRESRILSFFCSMSSSLSMRLRLTRLIDEC